MKKFTTLVMGSAAAVSMLASGAQAADPPLDEPAVAVCDAFGTGFWAIPGTSNCIKISGEVRADYTFSTKAKDRTSVGGFFATGVANQSGAATTNMAAGVAFNTRTRTLLTVGAGIQNPVEVLGVNVGSINFPQAQNQPSEFVQNSNHDAERGDLAWSSRFRFNVDVQSMTEWGVLRAFGRFQGGGGGNAAVDKAYVQFAGLTAGYNTTNFMFDDVNDTLNGNAFDGAWTTHQLAYTYAVDGISLTLALEDPALTSRSDKAVFAAGVHASRLNTAGAFTRKGGVRDINFPDVVLAAQLSQEWGKIKLAGIYHKAEARLEAKQQGTPAAISPALPATPWKKYSAYAITAGAAINAPVLSGAVFNVAASYGEGIVAAIGMDSVIEAGMPDFTIDQQGKLYKTKGWSVSSGIDLPLSDQFMLNIAGGYLQAKNDINDPIYADLDVRAYALGASVKWSPVKDLGVSLGMAYNHAKYSAGRAPVKNGFTGGGTANQQNFGVKDFNRKLSNIGIRLRVERDF